MSLDIATAGKSALNAGKAQLKTWVIPVIAGTFIIVLICGFVPQLKKFLMA